jgi:co-chaperonin GroES (HSP10)|tara:strand:+ start:1719 stop:2138 length:420 start_codon:yes stop_codon:yes gene_type:complete
MAMASIDNLAPTRSLIDLTQKDKGDFGLDDYDLDFIFDDILLVEYVDETDEGDEVIRNGIVVPTNALTKAWRKGKIILAGPETKYAKEGDIVIFPNNMGVSISNISVAGKKKVEKGIFLNEERMFGICKRKDDSTESSS